MNAPCSRTLRVGGRQGRGDPAAVRDRGCSACSGECHAPEACHQPEAPRRPATFRPTFDITGPHLPRTRAGWGRLVMFATGFAGLAFIAGAVGRHLGVF